MEKIYEKCFGVKTQPKSQTEVVKIQTVQTPVFTPVEFSELPEFPELPASINNSQPTETVVTKTTTTTSTNSNTNINNVNFDELELNLNNLDSFFDVLENNKDQLKTIDFTPLSG